MKKEFVVYVYYLRNTVITFLQVPPAFKRHCPIFRIFSLSLSLFLSLSFIPRELKKMASQDNTALTTTSTELASVSEDNSLQTNGFFVSKKTVLNACKELKTLAKTNEDAASQLCLIIGHGLALQEKYSNLMDSTDDLISAQNDLSVATKTLVFENSASNNERRVLSGELKTATETSTQSALELQRLNSKIAELEKKFADTKKREDTAVSLLAEKVFLGKPTEVCRNSQCIGCNRQNCKNSPKDDASEKILRKQIAKKQIDNALSNTLSSSTTPFVALALK